VSDTAGLTYPSIEAGHRVSIVIPMFNEEACIEHAVACGREALDRYATDWEIVIVDDCSTDGSVELVRRMQAADERVRLVRHERNRGLGATLRTGFAAARLDVVLYMDADLPFDPDVLGQALRALDVTRSDVIAGYRFDRTTEGFRRTVYSYCYNTLIGFLFGWPHRDINFSFKLMRRQVLDALELRSEGSLIDAELIVKSKNLGFRIQQIGIDYFVRTRGSSTLSSFPVIRKMIRELWRLYPEMRNPRRPETGGTDSRAAIGGAEALGASPARAVGDGQPGPRS
jgi:glycosyltransferase involved in cell wall biosynthesis